MQRYISKATSMLALSACIAITVPTQKADAAGIPVIDPAAIAQLLQQAGMQAKEIMELQKMLSTATKLNDAIGAAGKGDFGSLLNQAGTYIPGLAPLTDDLKDAQYLFKGIQNKDYDRLIRFAQKHMTDPNSPSSTPHVSQTTANNAGNSVEDGRKFTKELFYLPEEDTNLRGKQTILELRTDAHRDAAVSAHSLALHMDKQLSEMPDRMEGLGTGISQAKNLRDDVRANTAVAFVMLEQLTNLTAIDTARLKMEATEKIKNDPVLTRDAVND